MHSMMSDLTRVVSTWKRLEIAPVPIISGGSIVSISPASLLLSHTGPPHPLKLLCFGMVRRITSSSPGSAFSPLSCDMVASARWQRAPSTSAEAPREPPGSFFDEWWTISTAEPDKSTTRRTALINTFASLLLFSSPLANLFIGSRIARRQLHAFSDAARFRITPVCSRSPPRSRLIRRISLSRKGTNRIEERICAFSSRVMPDALISLSRRCR